MKRVVFLGLAVLLLLGVAGAVSAAPATTKYDEGVIYGHWVSNELDIPEPLDLEVVLYARQDRQGYQFNKIPALGWWSFSEIQCLRIEGNRAWLAGFFTKTNVPGIEGTWGAQLYVDNGDGDEAYAMTLLPKAEALHICQSMAPESEWPRAWEVVEGDVIIIDKPD